MIDKPTIIRYKFSINPGALLLALFLLACDKDDTPEITTVSSVNSVRLVDVDNSGSPSDLLLSFGIPADESNIAAYRVYLIKSVNRSTFDLEEALQLASTRFVSLNPSGAPVELNLPATLEDADGDAISDQQAYVAMVVSVPNNPDLFTPGMSSSNSISLKDESVILTLVENLPSATGGVAVDANGNIYVADIGAVPNRGGSTIFKISPEGIVSTFASGSILRDPSGNAFDSEGNLFQSNLSGHNVLKITPDGVASIFASEGIRSPVGIVIDKDNNLFVANCGSNTIAKVAPDGTTTEYARSGLFRCPNGIALDNDGNLYVTNFEGGLVTKITTDGTVSSLVTVPGGNNGHITYQNGRFYVISRGGNRIYTMDLEGNLTPFAGNGLRATLDGSVSDASFTLPNDLSISPDGQTLYFNHSINTNGVNNAPSVIRKIVLN